MKRQILVTGFESFAGHRSNPSAELAQRLDGRRLFGRTVLGQVLPVVFGQAAQKLRALIRQTEPEMVVALGLAADRQSLSLERVAVNLDDAALSDNQGNRPVDRPIHRNGPAAYFSSLPLKTMHRAVGRGGWPVEVSNSAGTFVCNHVYYCLLHQLRRYPGVRGGFIHLPRPRRGFDLDAMEAALERAMVAALRCRS